MSSPFPRCETLPLSAGCHATEAPCLFAPPNDRLSCALSAPCKPIARPALWRAVRSATPWLLPCDPASGSVPLNSYRYSPFVSTLQARVLTRYLRVIFASQFGNFSRNRPQSKHGNGAKTATHIPSERPDGCGRFEPAKSPKLGPCLPRPGLMRAQPPSGQQKAPRTATPAAIPGAKTAQTAQNRSTRARRLHAAFTFL